MKNDLVYIQEIENEIKAIRKTKDNYKNNNEKLTKMIIEKQKLIDSKKEEKSRLKLEKVKLLQEIEIDNKKFLGKERLLLSKIKRKENFSEKNGTKNKIENILKSEKKIANARNYELENIILELGWEFGFDGNLINLASGFVDKNDEDNVIKKLIKDIIQRNKC